jgi:hypothetical protein
MDLSAQFADESGAEGARGRSAGGNVVCQSSMVDSAPNSCFSFSQTHLLIFAHRRLGRSSLGRAESSANKRRVCASPHRRFRSPRAHYNLNEIPYRAAPRLRFQVPGRPARRQLNQ